MAPQVDAAAVGWWWSRVRETRGTGLRDVDRELDAVAVDDDGRVIALGSCKWTAGPLPYSEKSKLDRLAAFLVPDGPPPELYLFARGGFEDSLEQEAQAGERVHLVTPDQLFG
jgi:hypothetical protein